MKNVFTEHPNSVNESYWQHFGFAISIGITLFITGCVCIIHGFLPFFHQKTASKMLLKLAHDIIKRNPNVEKDHVELADLIYSKYKDQ